MRPNARAIVFAAVFAAVMGYPVYAFVSERASGGVTREGDLFNVDLKAMTTFDLHQEFGATADVPARWRALDGRRVALQGQMAPNSSTRASTAASPARRWSSTSSGRNFPRARRWPTRTGWSGSPARCT